MAVLEYWLRGPLPHIPALLQPVAHALLQVDVELKDVLAHFDETHLWKRPNGVASVGFHLQHLTGVLDRLCTYARGEMLSETQLGYLQNEGMQRPEVDLKTLMQAWDHQLARALEQLKKTDSNSLTEIRYVGRKRIETTVIGLLFHAAEHSTRHFGQLMVTVRLEMNNTQKK